MSQIGVYDCKNRTRYMKVTRQTYNFTDLHANLYRLTDNLQIETTSNKTSQTSYEKHLMIVEHKKELGVDSYDM